MLKKLNINHVKYIISGLWNTIFSYLIFVILYKYSGIDNIFLVLCLSQVIGITNAYLVYKIFVFKTKKNIVKEYLKFYVVYGATLVFNFIFIFILVDILNFSPILSQAIIAFFVALLGFIGHNFFTFQKRL